MKHATYIGPRADLHGKGCLLLIKDGVAKAQFDNHNLKESHGWHEFPVNDFTLDL